MAYTVEDFLRDAPRDILGMLPPEVAARLSAASDSDLADWGERVIEAASLAEVFNGA